MVIGFLYLKGRSNLFMHTKNTRELPTYSLVELLTPGFKLLFGNLTLFIGIYSKIIEFIYQKLTICFLRYLMD